MTIVSLCTFFIIQIPPPFPFPPMDAYDVVWNSFTSASHCLRFHLPPIPYDATSYHTVPHHVRLCLYLSFMPSLSIDSVLHAGLCRINLFTFNFSNGFDMWNGKALAFVPISSSLSPLPMFCMRCTALSFHSLRSSAHFVYLYVCFGTKCVFFPFEHFILLFLFIQCNDSIFHFSNKCVRVEHEQNYIWKTKQMKKAKERDEKSHREMRKKRDRSRTLGIMMIAFWLFGWLVGRAKCRVKLLKCVRARLFSQSNIIYHQQLRLWNTYSMSQITREFEFSSRIDVHRHRYVIGMHIFFPLRFTWILSHDLVFLVWLCVRCAPPTSLNNRPKLVSAASVQRLCVCLCSMCRKLIHNCLCERCIAFRISSNGTQELLQYELRELSSQIADDNFIIINVNRIFRLQAERKRRRWKWKKAKKMSVLQSSAIFCRQIK